MENTSEFVEKLHATQKKAEKNLRNQGEGDESAASKLSKKKSNTNK